jgi:hypothetical protein
LALAAAVGALAGCNPLVFDDLADETWVDSSERPDGLNATDYAVGLAAAGAQANGARFIAAGNGPGGLASLGFGEDGARDTTARNLGEIAADPATPTLNLPSPAALAGDSAGRIAVGLPDQNDADRVLVVSSDKLSASGGPLQVATVTGLGQALAFSAGAAAEADLVAAATADLVLFPGGTAAGQAACAIGRERIRGIAAAEVSAVTAGEELFVASGDLNVDAGAAAAQIDIIAHGLIQDAAAATSASCFDAGGAPPRAPLLTLAAPGDEPDFGAVLAVGDFNGAGGRDLAAAAPSAGVVYVYLDLDPGAAAPTPQALRVSGAARFGAALAAGDIDGDGADELLIGAPDTTVEGELRAGSAFIFQLGGGELVNRATLHDIAPESNQQFGRAVLIAPFGANNDHIAVVATDGEVFTYFQTPLASDVDVRQ